MLPFLRKRSKVNGRTAVGFLPDGIAVARVRHAKDAPPVLEACEFHALADGADAKEALAALNRRLRLDAAPCSLVMAPDAYSLLLVEAPDVPPEELRAAVKWRIRELIDFHVDDAVIDVFDVPTGKSARGRMMYVVAGRVPAVRQRTDCVTDAGLDLTVVDVAELALRNLAEQLPEDLAGVALASLGPRSGLITLTRRGTLFLARHLESGLDALPLFGGERESDGGPPMAVRGWLDSLVVEVQRSLDYYESHFNQPPISSLVIAPQEKTVPGMTQYLADQLGLGVRTLDVSTLVDCTDALDPALQSRCFAVIGAALRAEERTL